MAFPKDAESGGLVRTTIGLLGVFVREFAGNLDLRPAGPQPLCKAADKDRAVAANRAGFVRVPFAVRLGLTLFRLAGESPHWQAARRGRGRFRRRSQSLLDGPHLMPEKPPESANGQENSRECSIRRVDFLRPAAELRSVLNRSRTNVGHGLVNWFRAPRTSMPSSTIIFQLHASRRFPRPNANGRHAVVSFLHLLSGRTAAGVA